MTGQKGEAQRRPGDVRAAAELAALVRESVAANAVREVLYLRLSGLGSNLQRPHHLRLVRDALEPVLAAARTRVFELPNGDLVAVSSPPGLALETARAALMGTLDAAAGEVVQAMRLPAGAALLLAATAQSLGLAPAPDAPPGLAGLAAMTSFELDMAERILVQADLGAVTLAQGVCRLDPERGGSEHTWEDRRIVWSALAASVVPGFDIEADTTLQRRLARLVELRMLADIARPSPQLGWRPVGLPISPATLSSPGFQRFDQSLPAGRRQEIMLAFRACDVMADPGGFVRARDIAHQRGYRLALDDAPVGLLDVLREDRLGLDLVRLRWSADLPASMPQGLSKLLLRPDRVVLTGVDRPAAIAWGWEVGLRCFQGPLVERRQGNA